MAKYKYIHPVVTHVSLKVDGKKKDISLHNGSEYDLPVDNEFVNLLVLQKKLIPVIKETRKQFKEQ